MDDVWVFGQHGRRSPFRLIDQTKLRKLLLEQLLAFIPARRRRRLFL
jgi:hypothetical protein